MISTGLDTLVESIIRDYEPEMVLLFGSQARGDATTYSDIDIIIVQDTKKRFKDRVDFFHTATEPSVPVDLIVYTPQEFRDMVSQGHRFVENALRDGIVLYDSVGYYSEIKDAVTSGRINMQADPAEEGRTWLGQAELFLRSAIHSSSGGFYAPACSQFQQTAETALKAFLYSKGERYLHTHSVDNLRQLCESYEPDFGAVTEEARNLDGFYLTTRYPDTVGGRMPAKNFDKEDAQEALERATRVIELVRKYLEQMP
ncbi:MAG: HEPN domain-containing protein [Dehalococcoidia bacterium]|nr:HEPN domain-containing protein [Dehalococcoidia bacterium]